MKFSALLTSFLIAASPTLQAGQDGGPLRILFLGHESTHHPSNEYYPMLAKALGRDGIYFDYHTSVEEALGDYDYLSQFDGLLLYANHETIEDHQYENLIKFVESGHGFIPVHCASYCFRNKFGFVVLVGGQFKHHKGGDVTAKIIKPDHPALKGVKEFTAWDETYVHDKHGKDRDILMVREPTGADDNIKEPEPWTWTRTQGKGRVFYTASGHDQRVWSNADFHQLLKSGILWAIGDERKTTYDAFIAKRPPLKYEKRDNIPNYERRTEPLPFQLPLSPEASLQYTQAPVGWKLELFAAEPDIINPISLAWDERGRLWVAETVDYPNEIKPERKGNDKIKILEDTDGDGRCDKVTVFADGLNIPTSLTFANGGVYVHHAPNTFSSKIRTATTKPTKSKWFSPGGEPVIPTPGLQICATGSTTTSGARLAIPLSTRPSATSHTALDPGSTASTKRGRRWSSSTSSTTTRGDWVSTTPATPSDPPRITTRRFSAVSPRPPFPTTAG